jgi:hypothetical protein
MTDTSPPAEWYSAVASTLEDIDDHLHEIAEALKAGFAASVAGAVADERDEPQEPMMP